MFAVCGNREMIVLNADNGKVVADLPIGEGSGVRAFDPKTRLAFSSNGEGTVTIVREDNADKFSVVENVKTRREQWHLTLKPKEFTCRPLNSAKRPRRPPASAPLDYAEQFRNFDFWKIRVAELAHV